LALILLAALPAPAMALGIDQLRLGTHPEKTRLVLEMDAAPDFRAFILDNPHRLVVDLPDLESRVPGRPHSALVRNARTGQLQAGFARLVFDLSGPAKVLSAFVLPRANGLPDRLVIDIAPVSAAQALAAKDKLHGTL